MKRSTALCTLGLGLMAAPAMAQDLDNQDQAFVETPHGLDLSLDVSEDESKAVVGYGGWIIGTENVDSDGPRIDMTWGISAEYPVGGKDNLAKSATLDKLVAMPTFSAKFGFVGFQNDEPNFGDRRMVALVAEAELNCKTLVTRAYAAGELTPAPEDTPAGKDPQAIASTLRDKQLKGCTWGPLHKDTQWIAARLPANRLAALNSASSPGFWTLGIEGSIGHKKYDFVVPGTFAEDKQRLTAWSINSSFAWYPANGYPALKTGLEFSRAPEDLKAGVVCKTVVITPADDCKNALSRAPKLEDSLVLRFEVRRFWPFANGKGGIGAALTTSTNLLKDEWGVEVPVFFNFGDSVPVMPGVSIGYTSEEDDITFGVFAKTSFKF